MKTAAQIAEENIRNWREQNEDKFIRMHYYNCERRKALCKRSLDYLEENKIDVGLEDIVMTTVSVAPDSYGGKIEDLEQVIKLYEEAGIGERSK